MLSSRKWELGPASLQGTLPSREGQAEAGSPGGSWNFQNGTAVGPWRGWRRSREDLRADTPGQAVWQAKEHRTWGLREARASRPLAWAPVAAIAAATTLQAVVVIGVTAAASTVQLPRAKLHALYVHLWGNRERMGQDDPFRGGHLEAPFQSHCPFLPFMEAEVLEGCGEKRKPVWALRWQTIDGSSLQCVLRTQPWSRYSGAQL
jgi:hypothetical protein